MMMSKQHILLTDSPKVAVQKYGGSSLADPAQIRRVATLVAAKRAQGFALCIVVSALGKTTDQLLGLAQEVSASPTLRELDMLLTCGERVSCALLSMALSDLGVKSISLTGSQAGIITDDNHANARILEIKPHRVQEALVRGEVVILAGYQGVSISKEITTLGRGGSDTTAVAMAHALNAESCEIFSDVDGVFTADPNQIPSARKLDHISFDCMLNMAQSGGTVIAETAVHYAKATNTTLRSRKTGSKNLGTYISSDKLCTTPTCLLSHQAQMWHLQIRGHEEFMAFLGECESRKIQPDHMWLLGDNSHHVVFAKESLENVLHPAKYFLRTLPEDWTSKSAISIIFDRLADGPMLVRKSLTMLDPADHMMQISPNRVTFYLDEIHLKNSLTKLHAVLIEKPIAPPSFGQELL